MADSAVRVEVSYGYIHMKSSSGRIAPTVEFGLGGLKNDWPSTFE